jgi:YD repeat-containing protein
VLDKLKWRKLDRIEIYNNDDLQHPARKFEFVYNNTFVVKPSERLRLERFGETSMDSNVAIPAYEFYYEPFLTSEPVYLQNQTDHWGFFNGVYATLENNTTAANFLNYTAKRNPDPAFLLGGTLNKIVYPTGGTAYFSFEPHTYSQEIAYSQESNTSRVLVALPQDKVAGGIRIARITTVDNVSHKKLEKRYYYTKDYSFETGFSGRSSGILGGKAQYYWDGYKTRNSDDNITYTEEIFSTQSVLPMSENSMGSHIGYSEVVEVTTDGNDPSQDNGVTVYKFTNFDNGHEDEPFFATLQETRSPFEPYNSKALERGHLLGKKVYDVSGRLIAEDVYEYAALNQDHVRAIKASAIYLCRSDNKVLEGTAYKINTYQYKPKRKYNYQYSYTADNQQKSILTTTAYTYTGFGQLEQETISQSNGQEKIVTYKYPYSQHLIKNLASSAATALNKMLEINILPVIEKQEADNTKGATLLERYNFRLENNKVVPDNVQVSLGDVNLLETRYSFHYYDEAGNLSEESKAGDMHHATLWGYGKTLPIARVTNATLGGPIPNIFHTSFEDVIFPEVVAGNARTGTKSYNGTYLINLPAQNGTYNLSWWSRPVNNNGWELNKQSIIISHGSPAFISIGSASENIDEVRLYPENAQVTTYTYDPIIGMTSSTDANNVTTYYEYDVFGRLERVIDNKGDIVKNYHYNFMK